MKVAVKVVADMVQEASTKMNDAGYSQVMVGSFVQEQPSAAKYISAHATELGGAEGVINAIFHAALIARCYQRANNRSIRAMSFEELDHVADGDREERLKKVQPAIFEYIEANIELAGMKSVLTLLALAMDWVS